MEKNQVSTTDGAREADSHLQKKKNEVGFLNYAQKLIQNILKT